MNFLEITQTKKFLYGELFLLFAFFCLRLINIDADLPSWNITNYTPVDEGTYAAMALNQYNYGEVNVRHQNIHNFTHYAHRNNVIGNLVVYLSMKLFGDNYFAFRFPSFVWTLATLVLLFLLLKRNLKEGPYKNCLLLAGTAIPVFNFIYTVAGRVVEPSTPRMFLITLIAYCYFSNLKTAVKFLIMGFLSAVAVMLVYMANAFMIIPCLWACWQSWRDEKSFVAIIYYILGCSIGYVIGEAYYLTVWDTSFFINSLQAVSDFSNIAGYKPSFSFRKIIKNAETFFQTNVIAYNVFLTAFLLSMAPVVLYGILKQKDKKMTFCFLSVTGLFIQCLYADDYIVRKQIVIYPFLVLLMFLSVNYLKSCLKYMKNVFQKYKKSLNYVYFISFSFLFSGTMFLLKAATHKKKSDFSSFDKGVAYIVFLICVVYAVKMILSKKRIKAITTAFGALFIADIFMNICFTSEYVWFKPKFGEKRIMQMFKNYFNSGYVLGEWAYSYTLYNDIKPVEGKYDMLAKTAKRHPYLQILLYDDYSIDSVFIDKLEENGLKFEQFKTLPRFFKTDGRKRPFALYRIVRMEEE